MKKLLLGLLSLLSLSCLFAEDMAIEKIDKVAVIDGIADDEVWKNATSMPNLFTKLNSDGVKAVSNTSLKLFHNGKALYLLFEAHENDAKKLVASQKNHDDGVWLDDCVEVMLSSQGNAEPYYHFMVNTLGTQYDSKIAKSRVDAKWNGNWKAATSKNDNGYVVEMELPFSMFEMANSTTWRMLLARENKVKNEYSCFPNITTASFHTPSRFVNLNGIEVDKDCYVVVPKSCNFEFGGNEAGIITGKLNLNFESFKDLDKKDFSLKLKGKEAGNYNFSLGKKGTFNKGDVKLNVPVSIFQSGVYRAELYYKNDLVKNWDININGADFEMSILYPRYRNYIFDSMNLKELKVEIVAVNDSLLNKNGTLELIDEQGKVVVDKKEFKIDKKHL